MGNSISTKKRNIAITVLACLALLILFIITRPSHANILDTDDFSLYDTWDGISISDKLEGEGTEAIPYFIKSANDFALFQKLINEDCTHYCDKYYYLKQNINFDNLNFEVIGSKDHPFTGTFDGNGYSLARIKVNSDMEYVGVFAYLDGAIVRDLNIKEATINGADNDSVGVLAGVINKSTISNIALYDSIINANDTNSGLITGTSSNSNFSVLFVNGTINLYEEVSENLVGVSNDSTYDYISNYVKNSPNTYLLESDDDTLGENIFEYTYDEKENTFTFSKDDGKETYVLENGLDEIANLFNKALDNRFIWRVDVDYLRFDNTTNVKNISLRKARVQPSTTLTTHASGQDSSTSTIYVNDLTADWDYYQGLNYTFSTDDGLIPDGTDQNLYTESNMVQMQITYDGSTYDGLYTGYISNTEQFSKMVYFHYYPVNNNGTSNNTSDDYVEFELIDNPWAARPGDRVFNGWVTSYSGVTNNINTNYYYRYIRVPVTYSNGVPVAINITFYTAWFEGKIGYTSSSWSNIFSGFESAGFHTLSFSDKTYRYLPNSPVLYLRVSLERYESCEGLYANGSQNPGNSSCQCTSWQGCTYYRRLNNDTENVEYVSGTTYYQRGSNYRFSSYTINTNNLITVTVPNTMRNQNLAGLFTCQTYNDSCLIKPGDAAATYSSSRTYYYYATRDTNIAVLSTSISNTWSGTTSNNKPFTFTGLHDGTKYNTTWTVSGTYAKALADTRIEFITTASGGGRATTDPTTGTTDSRYVYGNNKNMKIGRGMGRDGTNNTFIGVIGGSNATGAEGSSASSPIRYRLIVESGYYNQIVLSNGPMTNTTTKYFAAQAIYGNDVDRVGTNGTNVNNNLDVYYDANGSWGGQYATTGTASTDHGIIFDTTVKSGSFGTSKDDGMAGMYIGGRSRGGHNAASRMKLEGGYVFTVIGGPYTQNTARRTQNNTYFHMTGGSVDIIYGGAGTTACYGNRILQITGGQVNFSVFGGSNGGWGSSGDGSVGGSSFVYVGGHAVIGDPTNVANGTTLDITDSVGTGWNAQQRTVRVPAGHVFGMGNGYTGFDDIGAMINSNIVVDGDATINGSVFGGGNEGAIGVTGNYGSTTSVVTIQVLNGDIKGSVYGGGNNNGTRSGVTSTVNITMSGGLVEGSVFGGSCTKGVLRGNTNVNIYGGTVKTNVYGGGQGGIETNPSSTGTYCTQACNVTIGNSSLSTGPTIEGTVYGGSAFGTVNGDSNNNTVSSYGTTVTVNKGTIGGDVFGGSQGDSSHTPYVKGNITVNINDGAITGSVYGTNDAAGQVNGNATVHLAGGSMDNAFGGGNAVNSKATNIYLEGSTVTHNVYGGGNQAGATTTNVHVTSGSASQVFGGSNQSGNVTDTHVDVTQNGTLTITDVFGGNNAGGTVGTTDVDITNSTVANVYGGNNLNGTSGNTDVYIAGSTINNVYGGGKQAVTTGDTIVTISTTTVNAALYGGGDAARVNGNTSVDLTTVSAKQVFGGGNNGAVGGDATVVIRTSTIKDTSGTITDNIFGGGNAAAVEGDTSVTLTSVNANNVFGGGNAGDVEGSTTLSITGGTIDNNIYGGGNSADVLVDATTTVSGASARNIFGGGNAGIVGGDVELNVANATVTDTIFGAGNSAAVTGDVTTTITGTTTASYIYGGGNNGAVGGDIILNATGATVTHDIFGAGKGATATASSNVTTTLTSVHADYIYGGGNAGSVGGNSSVSVNNSTVSNDIFGGGNQAAITGSATSSVTGTSAKNIYGGGNAGATGAISQTVSGSTVTQNIYGAGKGSTASSTGVTSIINNSTTATNIFGGGNAGPVNGNVSLTVNTATTTADIYGGGNEANVTGTCTSNLTNATAVYIYGGGNNGACGNTNITVASSSASQDIYGAGKGATATVSGNVTGSVSTTSAVNIFGGGNAGSVGGNITMGISGSTATANIYGGGNQAGVGGNTSTTITNTHAVEIYGGGNNGAVTGSSTSIVDSSTISADIYGGGKGATATVGDGTTLTVRNGTTADYVYGGGNAGTVTGDVVVNTSGSTFTHNIYGGGKLAAVDGDITVTASTSSACGAYGGGRQGDVDGNTSLSLVSSTLTCPVFGGGDSAQVTGNSSLYADGCTINGNAFGGGNADDVLGNSTIIIDDTDITGSVYGGGNAADVLGSTVVVVGGDTTISDSLFGGGNSGAIGSSTNNNSTATVNLLGAEIGRNVYGGCNTSVVYGATYVNIGDSAANPTNMDIGDIDIGGTVFGGGEANASGSSDYDYSFISVTQGIDINIDGTGYDNNVFKISGSIFGSGNASSSTGPAYIYIKKLGTRDEPNCMISIQRGTLVTIDDSCIELSGAVDRTNKYDSVKYSFNRIDELRVKNGTALFLQKNANILKKWKSLDANGSPVTLTLDANGNGTPSADNRLYLQANTNLNVTLDQNAQEFGEVTGMAFLGMYNSYGEGTFQLGMYDESFHNGSNATGSDAIIGGSYVLGLHATSMNYEVDGFYSNYLNDAMTKIETRYVEPSPPSADYYIWTIGIEATSYEFGITASKYSSLGTHVLSMMDFSDGNTEFTVLGFNSEGLLHGVSLVNPANVPKIGLTYDEQNSILGLAVKAESQEWTSANSSIFTSEGTGTVYGDHIYMTDNTQTSPSLTFYLYHAKNITDNRDLGAVTLSLQSKKPKNEFEWDIDLITITIYLDEQNYTDDDAYDASITYGRKYEMPSLTSVNITNTSQFTAYYSLIAMGTFANIYGQNNEYYHALVSNYVLPVGTKITLLDLSDEDNIEYFYYQVDQASFNAHTTQLQQSNETEYKLSEFIYMDTTDKYYNDPTKNQQYFYTSANITVEEFVFIIDFEEAGITGQHLDNSLLFELRTQGRGVISVLGIRQDSMKFNLYESSNTVLNANVTYDDNNMYYGIPKSIGYDITVGYNTNQNSQSIVDTNYESDSMGINVELVDASNNKLTSSLLLGTSIKIGNDEFFPSSDGVFRIKLSNKVANLNKTLVLTPGSKLPAGNYKLYIDLFSSADGLHMTRGSDLQTLINLTMVGNANGISVTLQDKSKLINGVTGLNNAEETSFEGMIEFSSDLSHTNIRLNVYKRDTTAYNTYTYTEVDPATIISSEFPSFQGTGLVATSPYQVLIRDLPTGTINMNYALTGTIPSGTYKLVFGLYDTNHEIQTDVKYIIVKID